MPCDFVEPAHGDRLQAWIIQIFVRKDDVHFDLYGKLTPLHPALSLFTSFGHINLENRPSQESHGGSSRAKTR